MRKWIIIVAIIIIIIVAIPLGFGIHVKKELNELNGLRVPLKGGELGALEFGVTDQKQGWLHSTAVINVSYRHPHTEPAENNAPSLPILTAPTKISYGPFLRQETAEGEKWMFGQALIQAKMNYVTESLPKRFLEITGIETGAAVAYIHFFGEQTIFINTREIAFQDVKGQLNFSGLDLEIERSANGEEIAADIMIPHFNFLLYPPEDQPGGVRWLMDGINIQFIGAVDHPNALWYGTWFGEGELLVNNLQVDIDGEHYALNQLAIANVQMPGKDTSLLNGEAEIQFERVVINQNGYGPLEAFITYSNINRAAIEGLRKLHEQWFYADTKSDFINYLTPEQRSEFNNDLLKLVNQLPNYQIDNFLLITDQGNLTGKLGVSITGKANTPEALHELKFWQQNVDASFDIRMARGLAERFATWGIVQFYDFIKLPIPSAPNTAPGALVPSVDYQAEALNLLNQGQIFGIIKDVNDEYEMQTQFKQGRLIVNGKTFIDSNITAEPSATQPATQPIEATQK